MEAAQGGRRGTARTPPGSTRPPAAIAHAAIAASPSARRQRSQPVASRQLAGLSGVSGGPPICPPPPPEAPEAPAIGTPTSGGLRAKPPEVAAPALGGLGTLGMGTLRWRATSLAA